MKPLIGITMNYSEDDQIGIRAEIGGKGQCWQALADDYIRAVECAGGIPVLIPVLEKAEEALKYLDRIDGLLLSGGCDVDPEFYGEKHPGTFCTARDIQEMRLFRAAIERPGYPVLGICRGCQLMNVALGGSLHFDLDTEQFGNHFFMEKPMTEFTHTIEMKENSLIRSLMGDEDRVNSYHHQGVLRLGEGLVITASSQGMPECIEMPERDGFTLGVQWHPEGLALTSEAHMRIFQAFIKASDEFASVG